MSNKPTNGNRKPYYDNNWQMYKDAPDSHFIQHEYDDFMMWKGEAWDLPSSVFCLIRVMNQNSGKVKEYVYRKPTAARKRVEKLLNTDDIEFTVCRHETMQFIQPELIDDDYDDYEIYDSQSEDWTTD